MGCLYHAGITLPKFAVTGAEGLDRCEIRVKKVPSNETYDLRMGQDPLDMG
jgi:hypothetical protein